MKVHLVWYGEAYSKEICSFSLSGNDFLGKDDLGDDERALLAGAGAAHLPVDGGAELPGVGAALLGGDFVTFGFATDILTNCLLLATLE